MRRAEILLTTLLVVLSFDADAQPSIHKVVDGSEVSFLAKITGGSFTAKTEEVSGTMGFDNEKKLLSATISVRSNSFRSGIGMRDTHMREKYLQASSFAEIEFTSDPQEVALKEGTTSRIKGNLTINGVSQPLESTYSSRASRTQP